ncbi:MAG: polysaccharide biosynthesis/export family protein [Pyrinomonadaceae bacterium]
MKKIFQSAAISLVLLAASALAFGQSSTGSGGGNTGSSTGGVAGGSNSMSADMAANSYRIGPGDVLDIRVFNRPQLSGEQRVDPEGNIQMPLIDQKVKAACLSETELSKTIATAYLKYQRNPYVTVFIKEYSSQPVAVIGAVEKPGQIILRRRMRLFDAITVAGGQSKLAGTTVEIAHTGGASICDVQPGEVDPNDLKAGFVAYNLQDTLRGDERSNPWLMPGDYVRIPEAEQVFVVGNVFKPSAISLKKTVTVSGAIAEAGGVQRDTKKSRIRILRMVEGSTVRKEIAVNLDDINKHKVDDVILFPGDIVDVPEDSGKALRTKILNALTGGAASLPYLLK